MATISDTILTNLRLAGQRAYQAGMNAAASAGERLGAANMHVENSAKKMGGQLNQSVFNMGNVVQMAGRLAFALGAVATAATYVGLKFEANMEQSQVAFAELLNSGTKASLMLNDLFDLAAKTPFEFPQLVESSQKLLGFGMQANEIIPLMSKVGDAVAAVGADPERIDRITRALGQMQAKGKVYSEELLQLADAGLPAYQMLAEGLGVTGGKLNQMLRKGQVDAKTGLDILAKQMDKRYSGMAEKQSKTFLGLISTIKDYSRMILGFAVRPLFDYLEKKVLPVIARIETGIVKWGRSGGFKRFQKNMGEAFAVGSGKKKKGLFTPDKQLTLAQKTGKTLGKIWKGVSGYFGDLMDALAPAKPFWDNVLGPFLKGVAIGAFGGFIAILKLAIPVIKIVATGLGMLGKFLAPLRSVFYWVGFAIGFIFGPGKIFSVMTKSLGIVGRIIGLVIKPFTWLIGLLGRGAGWFSKVAGAIIEKLAPAGSKMEDFILRWLEGWQKFMDIFGKVAGFIRRNVTMIAGAFWALGSEVANKFVDGLKSKGGKIFGILSGPLGLGVWAAGKAVGAVKGSSGASNKPTGPQIPAGGSPYGPRAAAGPDARGTAFRKNSLPIPRIDNYVVLDGKIVAKSVAKNTEDKMARR